MDSQTMLDIAGVPAEARLWDTNTWMLANIIDSIKELDWHTVAAYSKNKPRPPKPFYRPKVKTERAVAKKVWPGKTIIDKGGKK